MSAGIISLIRSSKLREENEESGYHGNTNHDGVTMINQSPRSAISSRSPTWGRRSSPRFSPKFQKTPLLRDDSKKSLWDSPRPFKRPDSPLLVRNDSRESLWNSPKFPKKPLSPFLKNYSSKPRGVTMVTKPSLERNDSRQPNSPSLSVKLKMLHTPEST